MINEINISRNKQKLIVYVVLTVVTLAVFWQVNYYDFFIVDDNIYVTENLHVQSGITLDGLRWAFSTTNAEFWHPLTWLSLMFDYHLYGLNAGGYHLTNLFFHILSTLSLFWLFNRMTGAVWQSAFVAALFALHPLHVESVVWITKRRDVLSAFWGMMTLCLYVYYTESPFIRRYLLVLFSFVLALISKPIVVTLPVMMILLDYWPLKRFQSKEGNLILWQLKEKMPFFIFSAIFSIITLYAQYNPSIEKLPLNSRVANALVSFVIYLEKTFWPHDLAYSYPFMGQLPLWQISGAVLLISFISILVILTVKRLPHLFVGWLWYIITLLPVIGISPIRSVKYQVADRYTYLPLIGIGIMLAWSIPLLIKQKDIRKKILFPTGIVILAILSVLTWHQCGYWKNSIALINHTLQGTKDNSVAYCIRGLAYNHIGQYRLAIEDLNKAIGLDPNYAIAYYNRGFAYAKLGQYQRAIEEFSEAIRLQPNIDLAYYNRGVAYAKLGQYQWAIEDYNKAIILKPDDTEAYNNRGIAYLMQGNNELACRDVQKACAMGCCETLNFVKGKGYCH
jgi:protein O-mannosyl-transferase